MTHYRFSNQSPIDEITVMTAANGARRAYIHAGAKASNAQMVELKRLAEEKDWQALPTELGGKPVLELRAFGSPKSLLTLLEDKGFTAGAAEVKEDAKEKAPWMDMFRKRSLQASGVFMALADIGFMTYGAKEGKWEDTLAGLSYLSGSSVLTVYGRLDQSDITIRDMARLLLEYAEKKGLKTQETTANAIVKSHGNEGVVRKVNNLFREYPSEIGNMMYFVAGGLIAKSALQHHALAKPRPGMRPDQIRDMRLEGWQDVGLGSMTMTSGLFATLMKEKAHDPDKLQEATGTGIIDWLKSNPLAVASYGYMGSTLCHAFSTYKAYTRAKKDIVDPTVSAAEREVARGRIKSVPFRALFVGATLMGEILMSISSKGHGAGVVHDESVKESITALTAELILKQPSKLHEELIPLMACYLGKPEVLAMKDSDAEKLLREKIAVMTNNPWACCNVEPHQFLAQKAPGTWEQKMQPALLQPQGQVAPIMGV